MWLDHYVQTLATVDSQIEDTHSAAGAKEVTLAAQAALQHIFEDCQQVGTAALPRVPHHLLGGMSGSD